MTEASMYQDGDLNPEDLIYLANCEIEAMELKHSILPSINYFTEICKIILDSLR